MIMEIRNRSTTEVITDSQFRSANPNVSLPKVLTAELLDGYGYDPVLEGPQAKTVAPYETSVRDGVYTDSGQWFTKYIVGPVFKQYADENDDIITVTAQRNAYKASVDANTASGVRSTRDQKIAECDWTVLADSPLTTSQKTAWKTYRQALRDITSGDDFPHNITWPSQP